MTGFMITAEVLREYISLQHDLLDLSSTVSLARDCRSSVFDEKLEVCMNYSETLLM